MTHLWSLPCGSCRLLQRLCCSTCFLSTNMKFNCFLYFLSECGPALTRSTPYQGPNAALKSPPTICMFSCLEFVSFFSVVCPVDMFRHFLFTRTPNPCLFSNFPESMKMCHSRVSQISGLLALLVSLVNVASHLHPSTS